MLTELSLDTLLDQEFEERRRAERVQNSEVSYVRCLIGRNKKKVFPLSLKGKALTWYMLGNVVIQKIL